jgi:hypothetical protein
MGTRRTTGFAATYRLLTQFDFGLIGGRHLSIAFELGPGQYQQPPEIVLV